eukprot:PITA_19234
MPGIDPSIVVHEIITYPGAKPIRQRLRQVHPRKAAAIKAEVEKLLKAGFIYPIPLTDWVSNIVPVTKKQGTIRVCVDYHDINWACPKDNFPTPYIDQIIDECAGSEMYSFMDGFFGYNQINIAPADQHKTAFICPWGTFAYKKLPFGLKNASATFQRVMSYAFHDIRHIVQPYLDDLPAHSAKRKDHPAHLHEIFLRCRHYNIRLNPHKCVFCIEAGRLLGFVVSKEGIRLDPLKVEAIVNLPPPATLQQLQSLQGKANFLHRFVPNYAEVAKGFTRLLKKDVPFHWDAVAQESFERLKGRLISAPLLRPPNYHLAGGKYSKWIVILQDFDLEFASAKSKKSLVFAELICSLPSSSSPSHTKDHVPDETLFLISTLDPWYGDILTYLQMSSFRPGTSKDARRRIRHQSQPYRIIGDTVYRLGADSVLRRCLTHEEAERVLNDCHSGACGGHMFGYGTTQKILRAGYF